VEFYLTITVFTFVKACNSKRFKWNKILLTEYFF